MSWGMPSAGRGMLGRCERGPPALQPAGPARPFDLLFHLADRRQIFIQPALIGSADLVAQAARVFDHRIQHAAVGPADIVAEQAVERQGRDKLPAASAWSPNSTRCASCRSSSNSCGWPRWTARSPAPGWAPWSVPQPLGEHLIAADAGADFAAGGQAGAGQQIAGLATVNAADQGFLVVKPCEKQHLFAERAQRIEHLAQLHLGTFAAPPPFPAMKAIAGKEARKPHRRLRPRSIAQSRERFQPGRAMLTPTPRRKVRRESGGVKCIVIPFRV